MTQPFNPNKSNLMKDSNKYLVTKSKGMHRKKKMTSMKVAWLTLKLTKTRIKTPDEKDCAVAVHVQLTRF